MIRPLNLQFKDKGPTLEEYCKDSCTYSWNTLNIKYITQMLSFILYYRYVRKQSYVLCEKTVQKSHLHMYHFEFYMLSDVWAISHLSCSLFNLSTACVYWSMLSVLETICFPLIYASYFSNNSEVVPGTLELWTITMSQKEASLAN